MKQLIEEAQNVESFKKSYEDTLEEIAKEKLKEESKDKEEESKNKEEEKDKEDEEERPEEEIESGNVKLPQPRPATSLCPVSLKRILCAPWFTEWFPPQKRIFATFINSVFLV